MPLSLENHYVHLNISQYHPPYLFLGKDFSITLWYHLFSKLTLMSVPILQKDFSSLSKLLKQSPILGTSSFPFFSVIWVEFRRLNSQCWVLHGFTLTLWIEGFQNNDRTPSWTSVTSSESAITRWKTASYKYGICYNIIGFIKIFVHAVARHTCLASNSLFYLITVLQLTFLTHVLKITSDAQ